jgi:hypothetical protein
MHVIIWEFVVREEHIQQFISAYNSNGDWANLFRRAEGFLGTELLRSSHQPNIFVTLDHWHVGKVPLASRCFSSDSVENISNWPSFWSATLPQKAVGNLLGSLARSTIWCERGDSNPHGFTRQILSLVRLPIPPLSPVYHKSNPAIIRYSTSLDANMRRLQHFAPLTPPLSFPPHLFTKYRRQGHPCHQLSSRSTKKLIAKRPGTHRLPQFTSNSIQRHWLVDIIESASLETKI